MPDATVVSTLAARADRRRITRLTLIRNVCLLLALIAVGTVSLAKLASILPNDNALTAIEAGIGVPTD